MHTYLIPIYNVNKYIYVLGRHLLQFYVGIIVSLTFISLSAPVASLIRALRAIL